MVYMSCSYILCLDPVRGPESPLPKAAYIGSVPYALETIGNQVKYSKPDKMHSAQKFKVPRT